MASSILHELLDRLPEDKLSGLADYMQFLAAISEPPLSELEL
jgi:hypothetical protein